MSSATLLYGTKEVRDAVLRSPMEHGIAAGYDTLEKLLESLPIDPPQIVQTTPIATAMIHLVMPRAEIRTVMGPGIKEVRETLAKQGIAAAGPWVNHHRKMVARTVHHGGYEGLSAAWEKLVAWIAAQGLTRGPSLWEVYLTDPSENPDAATLRTELNRPLV